MFSKEWNQVTEYLVSVNVTTHSFSIAYNLELNCKYNPQSQRLDMRWFITKWDTDYKGLLEKVSIKNPQEAIEYLTSQLELESSGFMTEGEVELKEEIRLRRRMGNKWTKRRLRTAQKPTTDQ